MQLYPLTPPLLLLVRYRVVLGKKLNKTDRTKRDASGRCRYRRCTDAGMPHEEEDAADDDGAIVSNAKYTVPKVARSSVTRPVAYDWLLPDKHGV